MRIIWNIHEELDQRVLDAMQKAADQALICEGVKMLCSASVCLCTEEEIRKINSEHRGIDRSTDVLSFPSVFYRHGKTAGDSEDLLRMEYDDDSESCFLGDIFISVRHIYSQSEEYGHSVFREAAYLLVHGLCHLMGYDHIDPDDKKKMRQKEEEILSAAFRD